MHFSHPDPANTACYTMKAFWTVFHHSSCKTGFILPSTLNVNWVLIVVSLPSASCSKRLPASLCSLPALRGLLLVLTLAWNLCEYAAPVASCHSSRFLISVRCRCEWVHVFWALLSLTHTHKGVVSQVQVRWMPQPFFHFILSELTCRLPPQRGSRVSVYVCAHLSFHRAKSLHLWSFSL